MPTFPLHYCYLLHLRERKKNLFIASANLFLLFAATLSILANLEGCHGGRSDFTKASVKLGKALNLDGIQSLVECLEKKNGAEMYTSGCCCF